VRKLRSVSALRTSGVPSTASCMSFIAMAYHNTVHGSVHAAMLHCHQLRIIIAY
jgi:hypothetical protein